MHDLQPTADETLDLIAGDWRIFQLRRGHRFSTDDITCAWRAANARPDATRLLDLGCGIGSVGLATLWRLESPDATLIGVEAQELSAGLFARTIRLNGLADRVRLIHRDLREAGPAIGAMNPEGGFDLITGSPPYFDVDAGIVPEHPQKAAARFELRGTLFDYCATARRWLAPGGRFAFVMPAADPRLYVAPADNGLIVEEHLDVVFREGRPPHIAVLVCRRAEDAGPEHPTRLSLTVRDAAGDHTPAYRAYQAEMGGFGPKA